MQDKLKAEADGAARLRKQAAELTVAKAASEQIANELQGMLASLQCQRDALQQEVASLQGQLSQEKSSRSHVTDLHKELEGLYYLCLIHFNNLCFFLVCVWLLTLSIRTCSL